MGPAPSPTIEIGGHPPRILHLVTDGERRGAQLFARRLADHLDGPFENQVCAVFGERAAVGTAEDAASELSLGGGIGIVERVAAFSPGRVWRLRRLMHAFQPDVIVAHGSTTMRYAAAAKLLRRRARIVYVNIGMASAWADTYRKVLIGRAFLRGIDTVVSLSYTLRDDFVIHYGISADRVRCIPVGVEESQFDPARLHEVRRGLKDELGLDEGDLILLTVGNLSEEKTQDALIAVTAGFEAEMPVHLVIVGCGPLRQHLEDTARANGVSERVHLLGTRADVPAIMAGADVFVLPSRTEGLPNVLIEAGLAGLPSVAYAVGGVAEVVEDGESGVLVQPGDQAGLSKAVRALLEAPDRRSRMGANARERCLERFTMETVAHQYEGLFREMLPTTARRLGNAA